MQVWQTQTMLSKARAAGLFAAGAVCGQIPSWDERLASREGVAVLFHLQGVNIANKLGQSDRKCIEYQREPYDYDAEYLPASDKFHPYLVSDNDLVRSHHLAITARHRSPTGR